MGPQIGDQTHSFVLLFFNMHTVKLLASKENVKNLNSGSLAREPTFLMTDLQKLIKTQQKH